MSNLSHLFKQGDKVRCRFDDKMLKGCVTEAYPDYIIVNVPSISTHCYYDSDMLGDVYPEYNFIK